MVNTVFYSTNKRRSPLTASQRGRLFAVVGALGVCGLAAYGIHRLDGGSATQVAPVPVDPFPAKRRVVTAARPIAKGRVIAAGDLSLAAANAGVPPGMLTDTVDAIGRIASADVAAGQPIRQAMLIQASTLALRVPPGFRAISLQTTEEIAVAGLVRPGDAVDVQLVLRGDAISGPTGTRADGDRSEARTLIENVPVLAVGAAMAATASDDGQAQAARTVTLALQPRQVSVFTLARSLGSLYLALRNPGDTATAAANPAVLRDIRGGAWLPPAFAPRSARAPSSSRGRPIQLVVGGDSRTVFVRGDER